jgi:hypothetical protein
MFRFWIRTESAFDAAWIQIHFLNADQYPRVLKRAKNEGENAAKRQINMPKNYKIHGNY